MTIHLLYINIWVIYASAQHVIEVGGKRQQDSPILGMQLLPGGTLVVLTKEFLEVVGLG